MVDVEGVNAGADADSPAVSVGRVLIAARLFAEPAAVPAVDEGDVLVDGVDDVDGVDGRSVVVCEKVTALRFKVTGGGAPGAVASDGGAVEEAGAVVVMLVLVVAGGGTEGMSVDGEVTVSTFGVTLPVTAAAGVVVISVNLFCSSSFSLSPLCIVAWSCAICSSHCSCSRFASLSLLVIYV